MSDRENDSRQKVFEWQIAGHGTIIALDRGVILKPIVETEAIFYETLSHAIDAAIVASFVPSFYGRFRESRVCDDENRNSATHIGIENLLHNYEKPCVLDMKIGKRQHGPETPYEKAQILIRKCAETTSASIALRICGYKIYRQDTHEYVSQSKMEGRLVTKDNFCASFRKFFDLNHPNCAKIVSRIYLSKLQQLKAVIEKLNHFRFYSSSILFSYDGNAAWDSISRMDTAQTSFIIADARMIDFAHSYYLAEEQGPDEEYLCGLTNMIHYLQEIADSSC
eukprot:TRINITY_DN10902_c0_g1_i1.p1 TRINITY_DN10902_c0_g1~~TRINITY_DN10902_c0_g1_i1.p1  ORF type:complete len:280 (+),score=62.72 TRINITY_DN10902_c0_g1_i1:43-882(+)